MAEKRCLWSVVIVLALMQAFPIYAHPGQDPAVPVAEGIEWVETHRLDIQVYSGKKPVRLEPCRSLLVVTPLGGSRGKIEDLVKTSVIVVRSERKPGRWEVYAGAGVGRSSAFFLPFTLPDNVFKVKQVIVSSSQHLVELRFDGRIIQVKPGDALLIL